jgi:hypothetical protein
MQTMAKRAFNPIRGSHHSTLRPALLILNQNQVVMDLANYGRLSFRIKNVESAGKLVGAVWPNSLGDPYHVLGHRCIKDHRFVCDRMPQFQSIGMQEWAFNAMGTLQALVPIGNTIDVITIYRGVSIL